MIRVVSLCLIFRMCQASPLAESKDAPKTEPNVFKKMANKLEKTQTWGTLKGWYEKAREWLVGKDGFITTFYHSSGDPPKKKCKCCPRCCQRRNKKQDRIHANTDYPRSRYPHGYGYHPNGNDRTANNYYFIDTNGSYGGDSWQPFDGNSVPAPFDGNGPQVVVTAGNGDPGCQMDCGGCPDLSNVDCSGCENCVSGCLGCICQPEVICCCLFLGSS